MLETVTLCFWKILDREGRCYVTEKLWKYSTNSLEFRGGLHELAERPSEKAWCGRSVVDTLRSTTARTCDVIEIWKTWFLEKLSETETVQLWNVRFDIGLDQVLDEFKRNKWLMVSNWEWVNLWIEEMCIYVELRWTIEMKSWLNRVCLERSVGLECSSWVAFQMFISSLDKFS